MCRYAEPPDIRDWFSSYESLQLSEFEGSFGGENEEEDGKVWILLYFVIFTYGLYCRFG